MPTYKDFAHAVQVVLSRHQRYSPEAYHLLNRAMEYASNELGVEGHMRAEELYLCYCKLAQLEFGPLAHDVLEHWGIRRARDVGAIVYHLIEIGIFRQNKNDDPRDFDRLPDLSDVLDSLIANSYEFSLCGKKHFFYPSSS